MMSGYSPHQREGGSVREAHHLVSRVGRAQGEYSILTSRGQPNHDREEDELKVHTIPNKEERAKAREDLTLQPKFQISY